jgi:hypothetical protein
MSFRLAAPEKPEIVPPGTPVIDPPSPNAPPGPVEPPVIPPGQPFIDPPSPDHPPIIPPSPHKPIIDVE